MDWELFIDEVRTIFLKPGQTYSVTFEVDQYIEVTISDGRKIKAYVDLEQSPYQWRKIFNWALTAEEMHKVFQYESEVLARLKDLVF